MLRDPIICSEWVRHRHHFSQTPKISPRKAGNLRVGGHGGSLAIFPRMSSRSCGLAWDEERQRGVELSWGSEEGENTWDNGQAGNSKAPGVGS